MVQHILPKGFQRHSLLWPAQSSSLPTNAGTVNHAPSRLQALRSPGYRVLPRPAFTQLFLATFGQDPLLCPRCDTPMEWELLYHPEYGILKEAQLFEEDPPYERTASECSKLLRQMLEEIPWAHPIAVVQLPLPFL